MYLTIEKLAPGLRTEAEKLIAALPASIDLAQRHPERFSGANVILISWSVQIDTETGTIWVTPTYSGIEIPGEDNLVIMMRSLGYDTRIAGTLGPLHCLYYPLAPTRVLDYLGIKMNLTQVWVRSEDRNKILAELLIIFKLRDGVPDGVKRLLGEDSWRDIMTHPNDS